MKDEPRFEVEKHTDHEFNAFRVRDLDTNETIGFGLLFEHALEWAVLLDQRAKENLV